MQLLKGCFPDVVVKAEKNKQQSWLCVTAFVSISTHFFGFSAGGVILFFSRWQLSRKGDTFQSSTLLIDPLSARSKNNNFGTCADPHATGQ